MSLPFQEIIVQLLPPRITLQIPEIPILVYAGTYYAKFVLLHIVLLMPLILYYKLRRAADQPVVSAQ